MEYTVGSLADLISGSNTPNKPKIIKREIKQDKNEEPVQKRRKIVEVQSDVNKKLKKKKAANEFVTGEGNFKQNVKLDSKNVEEPELNQNELNAKRRVKKKEKEIKKQVTENPEELARTLLVGNVPLKVSKKKIISHFKKYGKIESVRIRGIAPADPKTSKKVAAIKQEFHPKRNSVLCFIKFKNKDDCVKAVAENGILFEDHHLRVTWCGSTEKPDENKAIFVGNLSFDAEEEELWKLFRECGPISYIRIIRDSQTQMGKGFAYVNFKDSDAVQLALEMENVKLRDRELRISLCNTSAAKKNKNRNHKKLIKKAGKPKMRTKGRQEGNFNKDKTGSTGLKLGGKEYQGSKFTDKKKKRKVDKGALQKKTKIIKIAPNPRPTDLVAERFI